MVEAATNEALGNPLDLDLVGRPADAELGINNTVGGWSSFPQRIMRSGIDPKSAEMSCYLYYAGYGSNEIANNLGFLRQTIDLRVRGVKRPPLVDSLRRAFVELPRMYVGMDQAVGILRYFNNSSTPAEMATIETKFRPRLLRDKQLALLAAGFPIPELPEIPAAEVKEKPTWPLLLNPNMYKTFHDAIHDLGRGWSRSLAEFYKRLEKNGFEDEFDIVHRVKKFRLSNGETRFQNYYFLSRSAAKRFNELLNKRPEILRGDTVVSETNIDQGGQQNEEIAMTAERVIVCFNEGLRIFWKWIPWDEVGKLVRMAAEEIDVPVAAITVKDLRRPLQLLNGHSLGSLYTYSVRNHERGERDGVSFLLDKIGVSVTSEDAINRLRERRQVFWDRVPAEEILNILQVAADEIGVPLGMLGYWGIQRRRLLFLDAHSLGGLYGYFYKHPERNGRDTFDFMFEKVGITMTANDVVSQIKRNRPVFWARVPWEEKKKVVEYAAEELNLPTNLLGWREYNRHFSFLNGHTLSGFASYCLTQTPEKRGDGNTMQFIRRKRVPQPQTPYRFKFRREFRRQRMQEFADQYLQIPDIAESPTVKSLLPWIEQIARLYENTFFDITHDEIQSETVIYLGDKLQDGEPFNQSTMLVGLHRHLEEFRSGVVSRRYRETSLQKPIRENLALGDVLEAVQEQPTSEEVSKQMQKLLSRLSPFQRNLVWGIVVENQTLEQIAEKVSMDVDTLRAYYDDALVLLKQLIDRETDLEEIGKSG